VRRNAGDSWTGMDGARTQALGNVDEPDTRNGRSERVDHRSYERQGIDREPGQHFGPAAAHMVARGLDHDRLTAAADDLSAQEHLARIERELAGFKSAPGLGDLATDYEPQSRKQDPPLAEPDRSDDLSPGR